ncbi:MAG: undecaprenyl/decaprenyl-phosphate alpha-N-acetylglucosaminyl 1-phosphate transferase [Clostridia bacterium]|nr:undecaprenyl/decaprenyl-phosphate alpha-N-acetylglucosaminyl 1-phosphate transferase [Clostridia bacterium]
MPGVQDVPLRELLSQPFWVVLFLAFTLSLGATPLVRRLALASGALDRPNRRSVHTQPVPYLGGLAIGLAVILSLLATGHAADPLFRGFLAGGLLILLVGLLDDIFRMPAWLKFLAQVAVALVTVLWGGLRITYLKDPFAAGFWHLGWWGTPLTVFWLVAVMNVINLADGLDGLAAGITAIVAGTMFLGAIQSGQSIMAMTGAAALMGATLGFLPFNFPPARIFMGDAGALFLGFALATTAVQGMAKGAAAVALAVPALALGVPILDTAFAILRRARSGRSIGTPDRDHLHHRLLAMGLSQREAVLLIYMVTGWLGVGAIAISEATLWVGFFIFAFLAVSLVYAAHTFGLLETETSPGEAPSPRGRRGARAGAGTPPNEQAGL